MTASTDFAAATASRTTAEVEGAVQKLEGSLPDLLVDASLKFVEANRNGPFLLSLHFREPHTPYAPFPGKCRLPLLPI